MFLWWPSWCCYTTGTQVKVQPVSWSSWTKSYVFTLTQLASRRRIVSYEEWLPVLIIKPHMPPIRSGAKRGSEVINIKRWRYKSGDVNISRIGGTWTLKDTSLDALNPQDFQSGLRCPAQPSPLFFLTPPALQPPSHPSHLHQCR